ncbi:MAG: hypothetical protein J0H68_03030 [Sphingobacteriia bacterium]|nr:hypothetical protein [Sphingobacteriia bacterium]
MSKLKNIQSFYGLNFKVDDESKQIKRIFIGKDKDVTLENFKHSLIR